MKEINRRQNKTVFRQSQYHPPASHVHPVHEESKPAEALSPSAGRVVIGLVKALLLATKISGAAKRNHLGIHLCDESSKLVSLAKEHQPFLIVFDWDGCEGESFKSLKEIRSHADLKGAALVGYVSKPKAHLKEEALRAGCQRVFGKTEFLTELEHLLAR
ncbi:MAG: hypothetical protein HYZ85_04825 [Candidatus Omnitrophica bacterium]|nr:hypothetical protein [Candidatus Omnitrophota bacterium]